MRKLFFLTPLICAHFFSYAQNVGIGTAAPAEKLDVNGNINVTGTIKTNGVDGTPNQVLMKNSTGSLIWGDLCDYKNIATFTSGGTSSWTVPAGVTKVWVEAWGAGAGGCWYGGGGGGGYVSGLINVTPGNSISYTVGTLGNGGGATGSAGGQSQVSYPSLPVTFTAFGGNPLSISSTFVLGGTGGSYSATAGYTAFWGKPGSPGKAFISNGFQYNAGTFIDYPSGGDGGDAGNASNTGGAGGFYIVNNTTNTLLRSKSGTGGIAPGGGGGGGYVGIISLAGIGNSNGSAGAMGMVMIHY